MSDNLLWSSLVTTATHGVRDVKFRPTLSTLEAREVPSVVIPDDPTTTPPPYTPPADGGQPPGDPGTPPGDEPGVTPVNPDDPKVISIDDAAKELETLKARAKEIEKQVEALKKDITGWEYIKGVQGVAVNAARDVVFAASDKLKEAEKKLADHDAAFDPNKPQPQDIREARERLVAAVQLAKGELDGATNAYTAQVDLMSNIQQRIDAIKNGIKNLEAELAAIQKRTGEILLATANGAPIPAGTPIPKATVPTFDAAFNDWSKPLK
jgi:cell division protein FtsB